MMNKKSKNYLFTNSQKLFSAPQDIIMLMKEAIVFNLDGILDIIKKVWEGKKG